MVFAAIMGRVPLAFIPLTLALGKKFQIIASHKLAMISLGNRSLKLSGINKRDVIEPSSTGKIQW